MYAATRFMKRVTTYMRDGISFISGNCENPIAPYSPFKPLPSYTNDSKQPREQRFDSNDFLSGRSLLLSLELCQDIHSIMLYSVIHRNNWAGQAEIQKATKYEG